MFNLLLGVGQTLFSDFGTKSVGIAAGPGLYVESREITIKTGGAISRTSGVGEWSINEGAYTAVSGVVVAGDKVKVREPWPETYDTESSSVYSIASEAKSFTVKTIAEPLGRDSDWDRDADWNRDNDW